MSSHEFKVSIAELPMLHKRVGHLRSLMTTIERNCSYLDQMIGCAAILNAPATIDQDVVEELAIKLTRHLNNACSDVQFLLRDCCPDHLYDYQVCQQMMPEEDGYDVMVDDTGLYVKTPLAPVSAYRVHARRHKTRPVSVEKKRYTPLRPRLYMIPEPTINGPKFVYLLQVFRTMTNYRRCPDFDNFDCKSLIDEALTFRGGDGHNNIRMMAHAAMIREDLDEGTYMAVRAYDPSRTVAELEEEALERFGTMRQRQEDNP